MKILCYNIQAGCGGNNNHLAIWNYLKANAGILDKIADSIAGLDPDIVGLIEVDAGSFRSPNQAEYLAKKLGYYYASACKYGWAAALPTFGKQHLAILSKYPIIQIKQHKFSVGFKRLALEAVLQIESGNISIIATHLSLVSATRGKQIVELSRIINKISNKVVLLGDFNQENLEIRGLRSCSPVKTFPSWKPQSQLDYIFVKDGDIKEISTPFWRLSDHLPVYANVEI